LATSKRTSLFVIRQASWVLGLVGDGLLQLAERLLHGGLDLASARSSVQGARGRLGRRPCQPRPRPVGVREGLSPWGSRSSRWTRARFLREATVNVVLAVPLQRESACPARQVQAGAVRSSDITPLVAVSLTRWGPRQQAHSYDRDPHAAAVRSTDRHRCRCNAGDADVLVRLPRPGRSPGCRHTIRVGGGLRLASTGSQPVRRRTYCNPSPLRGMRPWYACTIDGNFRLAQAAPCSPNRAAVEPADRMGDEEGHGVAPSPEARKVRLCGPPPQGFLFVLGRVFSARLAC
jgi:hypothetical protein